MMEPKPGDERVPVVSAIDPLLPAAPPPARRRPVNRRTPDREAPGREVPVHELTVDISLGFHDFYASARQQVGRALAITLRDADLAADAVDEAMVRAYQRWDHVGSLDNPAGWVYRVGLNHALSRLRRLTRRLTTPPVTTTEISVADPAIERALANLSVDHRAVVVCRHLLGWSEAQTAAALDIRQGTVKSRLARALRQLEAQLDHLRPEDPS